MASLKLFFLVVAFVTIGLVASKSAEMSVDLERGDNTTGVPIPLKMEEADAEDKTTTGVPIPLGLEEADAETAEERQSSACIYYYWYGRYCRLCFWCIRYGSYSRCYYRSYC